MHPIERDSTRLCVDWILVRNGTPDAIAREIVEHSELDCKAEPGSFNVRVYRVADGCAVVFDRKPPPYQFANLISWLDGPPDVDDVGAACGWYQSRASGTLYFLRPHPDGSECLLGAGQDGLTVSVYLPFLTMCEVTSMRAPFVDLFAQYPVNGEPILSVPIAVDVDESFGNPDFVITDPPDTKW